MNFELDPKLLDVVEFEEFSPGASLKRTGTVVETFGRPPTAVLIEVVNSEGIPESFVTRKIEEVKRVWAAPASEPNPPEAQEHF